MRRNPDGVIVLTALLVAILAGLTAGAKSSSSKPAEAIKNADAQWAAAAATKDPDKAASFCAPDGAILPPNAPAVEGTAAIRKWFADTFKLPGFKLTWKATSADAAKSGDLGYSTGTYELSFNDASGKQVTDHGKYVTVWKKQSDGSWKVARDIFNSNGNAAP